MENIKLDIINKLKILKENENIEFKKAENNVPHSLWETYSAFCNTLGGFIILGVEESKNESQNKIVGIKNPDKIVKDIWNLANNTAKISYNILDNGDIYKIEVDNKTVIIIDVKEAPNSNKPVYLNDNLKETYIRKGEMDKKANQEEIRSLISSATPKTLLLDNFNFKDLDLKSVKKFKNMVEEKYPTRNYQKLTEEDFLIEIGAIRFDRKNDKYKLTDGCLLFLGKYIAITDYFSKYHLDFFYRGRENERWKDRVSSGIPNDYGEMNIFNFFNIVFDKIGVFLQDNFILNENNIRVSNITSLKEAIREALVNTLIHADYSADFPKVKIEMFDGWIQFENSGKMLVSLEEYAQGGTSLIRNDSLVRLVSLIGIAERQGFGGVKICKTSQILFHQAPIIETNTKETKLKLWTVDALHLRKDLTNEDKKIYYILLKNNKPLTRVELIQFSNLSEHHTRKAISHLVAKELISILGNGKSTRYEISFGTQGYLTKIQMKLQTLAKINNFLSDK